MPLMPVMAGPIPMMPPVGVKAEFVNQFVGAMVRTGALPVEPPAECQTQ